MKKYKTISVMVVDCSAHGCGDFEVLVIPSGECVEMYLRNSQYGVLLFMFGVMVATEENLVELAYRNSVHYFAEYIEKATAEE